MWTKIVLGELWSKINKLKQQEEDEKLIVAT